MPSSETPPPFDPETQELVILVHGTFANNSSKSRSDHLHWWQAGGDVWNKIDQQLPEQFHVASDKKKEVFSWSGDNSERDRRAGGRELFKHLQTLEKTGVRYHLIGHSHGGSVIWHCLLESVKQRFRRRQLTDDTLSLPGLRSYATIGTPFLQLRSLGLVSRFSPWFWMTVLIAAMIASGSLMLDTDDPKQNLDGAASEVSAVSGVNLDPSVEPTSSEQLAAADEQASDVMSLIISHPDLRLVLTLMSVLTVFFCNGDVGVGVGRATGSFGCAGGNTDPESGICRVRSTLAWHLVATR